MYSQSNEMVEQYIQSVKSATKKSVQCYYHINMVLQCLRTTPINDFILFGDELMYIQMHKPSGKERQNHKSLIPKATDTKIIS